MKILSQTPDEMVLQDFELSRVVMGSICLVVSLILIIVFFPKTGYALPFLFVPGMLLLFTGMLIFSSAIITVTLDKRQGQILFRKKSLTGLKTASYAIGDVDRVELRKQTERQSIATQAVLIFKDGFELPLENLKSKQNGNSSGNRILMSTQVDQGEKSIDSAVAVFLGVPLQEVAPNLIVPKEIRDMFERSVDPTTQK